MQLTRNIEEILLDEQESKAYYELCCSLPDESSVLEIGLFYGRSTSIVCQVGVHKQFRYVGVDPFQETRSALGYWQQLTSKIGLPVTMLECTSEEADLAPHAPFMMALIDGDHTTAAVTHDCAKVMPLIASGGYICLHDYGRSHLAGVKWGADATLGQSSEWTLEKVVGTLAIWRKS